MSPPMESDYLERKVLIFKDLEGYTPELLQWLKKPSTSFSSQVHERVDVKPFILGEDG